MSIRDVVSLVGLAGAQPASPSPARFRHTH
jgi:hypothetical protein